MMREVIDLAVGLSIAGVAFYKLFSADFSSAIALFAILSLISGLKAWQMEKRYGPA